MKSSILVLGLGNPIRRDDAIGLHVIRETIPRLEKVHHRHVDIKLMELCAGGFDLAFETLGHDALIVVDSFFNETSQPGRIRVFRHDELLNGAQPFSIPHFLSLPDALELCTRAGFKAPQIFAAVAIDVGPSCLEFGEELSEPVQAALPTAVDVLCEVIDSCTLKISHQSEVTP